MRSLFSKRLTILCLTIFLFVAGFAVSTADEKLYVHFIDVGQGDATVLHGYDFTVLIDTGRHDRTDLISYLKTLSIDYFDLVVVTHPHADHIGQFPDVLDKFEVAEVWMSGSVHTTPAFKRALEALLRHEDVIYREPRAGESYEYGSLHIKVLNPKHLIGDLHEDCIVLRLSYGEVSFIFTGDAEEPTEISIIERGYILESDILQLGHHGSKTSTSQDFIDAVGPSLGIYSAGRNNPYGHPHIEVLRRLYLNDIEIMGTDICGTIIVITDGLDYDVIVEIDSCLMGNGEYCIDINTASFERLQEIVHIGPSRADELIELRPFDRVEDLVGISGIGSARIQDILEQNLACIPHAAEEEE